MNDLNTSVKNSYKTELDGLVVDGHEVPVYAHLVPIGSPSSTRYYILIQEIISSGREAKETQDRDVEVQAVIHTRGIAESGLLCDKIASNFLNAIYPNRQSIIGIETQLISDNTLVDIDPSSKERIFERIIRLRHYF